jgi:hypothetical protein
MMRGRTQAARPGETIRGIKGIKMQSAEDKKQERGQTGRPGCRCGGMSCPNSSSVTNSLES